MSKIKHWPDFEHKKYHISCPYGSSCTFASIWKTKIVHDVLPLYQWSHGHYSDVIMSAMVPQIIGVSIVSSTVCSGADQSFASLTSGHRWIPPQRASNERYVSIWGRHHDHSHPLICKETSQQVGHKHKYTLAGPLCPCIQCVALLDVYSGPQTLMVYMSDHNEHILTQQRFLRYWPYVRTILLTKIEQNTALMLCIVSLKALLQT